MLKTDNYFELKIFQSDGEEWQGCATLDRPFIPTKGWDCVNSVLGFIKNSVEFDTVAVYFGFAGYIFLKCESDLCDSGYRDCGCLVELPDKDYKVYVKAEEVDLEELIKPYKAEYQETVVDAYTNSREIEGSNISTWLMNINPLIRLP